MTAAFEIREIGDAGLRHNDRHVRNANTGSGPALFIASSATMGGRYPPQLERINGLYDGRDRSGPRLLAICA